MSKPHQRNAWHCSIASEKTCPACQAQAVLGLQGVRHGQGTQHCTNGEVYTGDFAAGERHGIGRMQYSNGDVYEGQWVHGRRDGAGRLVNSGGDVIFEGRFINGMREGQGRALRVSKVSQPINNCVCCTGLMYAH